MLQIVFSGCDKVGKSTIIRELHKATQYKYPILDRYTESSIVYGKHRKRNLNYDEYFDLEKCLMSNVLLVYLSAHDDDIKKRIVDTNEKDITFKEIKTIKKHYENYLKETFFNYIIINTSKFSIKQCVNKIKNKIKEIEKQDGLDQIEYLIKVIEKNGLFVNNTLELQNINYKFKDISRERMSKYLRKNKLRNEKFEKLYYDRIYHSIKHIINSQMTEYGQNLYSRRFIFDSSECISNVHFMYRENVLNCYVNIRSSNVKKILPLDVFYMYRIAEMINNDFFKAIKIELNFKVASAHIYL